MMTLLLDADMEGGFAVVRDGGAGAHVGEITLRFDQGDLEVVRDTPGFALRWTTGERTNELGEVMIHLSEDNARELVNSILGMLDPA